jgi:putative glutamine amidotransferase
MRPQIVFSSNHNPTYHPEGYDITGPHIYIYSDYIRAIAEQGGAPLIIPCLMDYDYYRDSMRNARGLVLVGGMDVNPFMYNEKIEQGLKKISPDMDYGEYEIAKIALEMNIPILAICRGIQLLNVVLGGKLHQHLPDNVPDAMKHDTNFPPTALAHWINVVHDSLLYRIIEKARISVNSTHHQAIASVGQGAIVTARSEDGVIEAIEMPHKKWVLGVQWHPERIWRRNEDHMKLFTAFIEACNA